MNRTVPALTLALLLLTACQGGRETAADAYTTTARLTRTCSLLSEPAPDDLQHYRGAMHEHSSYSDGDIYSIPADYYAMGRERGLDFMASSEHSDTLDDGVFIAVGGDCFSTPDGLLTCLTPVRDDTLAKWEATAIQTEAASNRDFLAIRGFEWTSDRFGHINVYFSHNFTNAKTDAGYVATMESFWDWFTRAPTAVSAFGGSATSPVPFGGGGDGLAHFNHPSSKCLDGGDQGCNWNDYTLIPDAVDRLFGMELYNGGGRRDQFALDFVRALDKGWRLSPVGVEDEHGIEWGQAHLAKTITLATELSNAAFKQAWLNRRTYAVIGDLDLRIDIDVAGQTMGSRFQCTTGTTLEYAASVRHADGSTFTGELQLISNTGEITAVSVTEHLQTTLTATSESRYYFLRINDAEGQSLAFAAPIWIQP